MARLYRPHIPLEVRCRVLLRQLGEMFADTVIENWRKQGRLGKQHAGLLIAYSGLIGCEVEDLRLDHDPPLALRPQFRAGLGKVRYEPDANDPEYLYYRPHGAQFMDSHDIKTRVRGDHGQFSDLTLIKRARRRERPPKPKRPWPSRPFPRRQA